MTNSRARASERYLMVSMIVSFLGLGILLAGAAGSAISRMQEQDIAGLDPRFVLGAAAAAAVCLFTAGTALYVWGKSIEENELRSAPRRLASQRRPQSNRTEVPAMTQRPEPATADDGNFATSLAVADVTGRTAVGYAVGGSITGALIGESLSHSRHQSRDDSDSSRLRGTNAYTPGDFGGSSSLPSSSDTSSSPSIDFGSSSGSSDSSSTSWD